LVYLSIVIPAFNECDKIAEDIALASGFLSSNHLKGEVIVVDDGSTDGTAQKARQVTVGDGVSLSVIDCEHNYGKGYAVRRGMARTSGEYVMFADCGCCVPYSNVLKGLEIIRGHNADIEISHASRKMPESNVQRGQGFYRRMCSWAFRQIVVRLMGLSSRLTDTQCGFKVYRGKVAREIYSQCVTDGFMFDIEVILRAKKEGYMIEEFPIDWTCDRDSRMSPAKNSWQIIRELIRIKRMIKKS